MKKWKINSPDPAKCEALRTQTGLPPFICRILVSRGFTTREAAESFFSREELSDPFEIKDMDKAVKTLSEAVENGDRITVYGDYDCDGVTSTYMLCNYLETLGAEVSWYIPEREEGYGLNLEAVKKLCDEGTKLIVTVDNGISCTEEAKYIKELGMKLVITDHHEVPAVMPEAEAVVDPHCPDDLSEYKNLAGCGVVLKLIAAMENDSTLVLEQYADLAAIGTIGDMMKLDGENRVIVRYGLGLLAHTENMGLMQLLKLSGAQTDEDITSTFVAFCICPKINAASRYASPKAAMELLLCTSLNAAQNKAQILCELNEQRRQAENEIFLEAQDMIRRNPDLLCKKILIVSGEGWRHGMIGLASTKLLNFYGKPNIVITKEGDTSRGSCRSTEALSLPLLLDACADKLVYFGGHRKAAGLTVMTERIDELKESIYAYCDKNIKGSTVDILSADMPIEPDEISLENAKLIEELEPFGEGNRSPLFLLRGCVIRSKKSLKDGKYVSLSFRYSQLDLSGVCFGVSYDSFCYSEGESVDILANMTINEYGGKQRLQFSVKDIRASDFREDRYLAAITAYEDFRCGKVDSKLLCRMKPGKDDMKKAYDVLRQTTSLPKAEILADRAGLNVCMFRIILDVFEEFSLAHTDVTQNSVKLLPAKGKADLSQSKVIAHLTSLAV